VKAYLYRPTLWSDGGLPSLEVMKLNVRYNSATYVSTTFGFAFAVDHPTLTVPGIFELQAGVVWSNRTGPHLTIALEFDRDYRRKYSWYSRLDWTQPSARKSHTERVGDIGLVAGVSMMPFDFSGDNHFVRFFRKSKLRIGLRTEYYDGRFHYDRLRPEYAWNWSFKQ
jgi:hypothetical protein